MSAPGPEAVRAIFAEVPRTYELANHILTGGFDILWRSRAAKVASAAGGARWLDVCTGTGEMALALSRRARGKTAVFAADFSLPMMKRALARPGGGRATFLAAASTALPFADGSFDLVTISFATRNLNTSREALLASLREFRRVLRWEGVFVNLETSQPPSRIVMGVFHGHARHIVRRLGRIISGSRTGYAYLSHTLPRFYGADELAGIIREAGFSRVEYHRMTFGVVAIHRAVR